MDNLQQALAAADEAYLIGMSNKGTYKRACKDIEEADVSVEYADDTANVHISGEVCTVRDPLYESTCSCPSRSVCRHLIAAILFLRAHMPEAEEEAEEDAPDLPDIPAGLPEHLKEALQSVTEAQLKRAIGNKAAALIPQLPQITLEESSILSGTLPDGTAVRLIDPLEGSSCSCHKKELCLHKAAVILAWQAREGLCDPSAFLTQVQTLNEADAAAVRAGAEEGYALLCDVLRWGLVRMPENLAEHMEAAAVRAHALRMADAERMLRDIGSDLEDCRGRRAVFRADAFLSRLCAAAAHLEALRTGPVTESALGRFRRSYEEQGRDLTLLPIGQRDVTGGEYEGSIFYFLDLNENAEERFLTFSDLRPVFYDTVQKRRRGDAVTPWNAGVPMRQLMKSKLTLHNAKISGGKLSSSAETQLVTRINANLDCPEMRRMLVTDFREIAVHLSEHPPQKENDRLCLLLPQRCLRSQFDTRAQQLRMTLEDFAGNTADLRVRYRAESKSFIENLESIGRIMLEKPEKPYTWLCSAHFEDGQLVLFPIEVYNFIQPDAPRPYALPAKYQRKENIHAPAILDLLQETKTRLCTLLQTGLQSAGDKELHALADRAGICGMQGFSDLVRTLAQEITRTHHSTEDTDADVLRALTAVQQYTRIGRNKLEILCALQRMQPGA